MEELVRKVVELRGVLAEMIARTGGPSAMLAPASADAAAPGAIPLREAGATPVALGVAAAAADSAEGPGPPAGLT